MKGHNQFGRIWVVGSKTAFYTALQSGIDQILNGTIWFMRDGYGFKTTVLQCGDRFFCTVWITAREQDKDEVENFFDRVFERLQRISVIDMELSKVNPE